MGDPAIPETLLLLGLGNPLLDISANADSDFLKKYHLKPNDAIIAQEEQFPMYDDMIENYKVDYTPGGACQNTMRVTQWVLQSPNVCAFMGCIGKDKFGEVLESKAKEEGVFVSYQYNEEEPTGTCAVVITDKGAKRSLCANLSAANCFTIEHLEKPFNQALIKQAKFFYITGFFLTVSPPSIMQIAEHAHENDKPFCMNLSADFICQFYRGPMMEAMPYVDILFGNEQEALVFAKKQDYRTDNVEKIALLISELPKKNPKRPRIVIITQGRNPIICVTEGKTRLIAPIFVHEKLVDTNGAGDAFVGGFMARYIMNEDLTACIRCAIHTATEVIKQSGCTLPGKPNFDEY